MYYCCSTVKLPWAHISQRVLVPLNTRRPVSLAHQPLLVGCYGETVNGGECDHPFLLLPVEVIGRHPAGPVLFVPELVQLGQELFLNPHFPSSPHRLDGVDGVEVVSLLTGPQLPVLLVEAAAAAKEESVLVLDGVEGKYWLVRSSETDAGVTPAAPWMLALTVALLTSWNCLNVDPGPPRWFYSLWLEFISCAQGWLGLGLATVSNIVGGEGGQG